MPEALVYMVNLKFMNHWKNIQKQNFCLNPERKHLSSQGSPLWREAGAPWIYHVTCAALPQNSILKKVTTTWSPTICLCSSCRTRSSFLTWYMQSNLNLITKYLRQLQRIIHSGTGYLKIRKVPTWSCG